MNLLRSALLIVASLAACTENKDVLTASGVAAPGAAAVGGAQATLVLEEEPCSHCVSTVRTALAKIDGILRVDIVADNREFVVHYDPAKVKPEALLQPLKDAGEPAKIKT